MSNGELSDDDLRDLIREQAASPQSMSVDGESGTNRSLDDLIKADQYLGSQPVQAQRNVGLTRRKFRPPGAG